MRTTLERATLARTRAHVLGTVQGVGFRPFVYRLARELELSGRVCNDQTGVMIEAEGPAATIDTFFARLTSEAPPLAVVEQVLVEPLEPTGTRGFRIDKSAASGVASVVVAPDVATCEECLAELFDPADRRYRYPFLNCTNCGPRFTITRAVPYDRLLTTMASFQMCAACRLEYDDPGDRRFHAQPNACPVCGPTVRLVDSHQLELPGDPIQAAARRLVTGSILAVKGIGGYHLACAVSNDAAVAALRSRKHREHRPFALMVQDLDAAHELVELCPEEEELLCSPQRPIVLAARRPDARVAAGVAPAASELGVMLPYTPLHHLLLSDLAALGGEALVMTSGNTSDEPIAFEDDDAIERLAGIAGCFLVHDRPIHIRVDDSVVRIVHGRRLTIRRSRGYVPQTSALPIPAARPLLACGAEQKNTFCIAKGGRAWVGHHIGDLERYATLTAFQDGIEHFKRLFAVEPVLIAHDLHPDYLSTSYAFEQDSVELVGVQHHHAHLAACLAEHGLEGPAVGALYDGTGYGLDGTVWGGELLVGDLCDFSRAGSLWPVRMPGGAKAIEEPWRMAFAWLAEAFGEPGPLPRTLAGAVTEERWHQIGQIAASELVSPVTTSMGRLFDAVAALSGISPNASYEGQAAVELEAAASDDSAAYPFPVAGGMLDARETIRRVVADLDAGVDPGVVSARFHHAVAQTTATACATMAEENGVGVVVLSGGVFQNRRLLETAAAGLQESGLQVLVPSLLPPGDGGISFGQAAVAAARDAGTHP